MREAAHSEHAVHFPATKPSPALHKNYCCEVVICSFASNLIYNFWTLPLDVAHVFAWARQAAVVENQLSTLLRGVELTA